MPNISITCPHCSKQNEIVVSQVPSPIGVYCSHCSAPLGKWGDLERRAMSRDVRDGHPVSLN